MPTINTYQCVCTLSMFFSRCTGACVGRGGRPGQPALQSDLRQARRPSRAGAVVPRQVRGAHIQVRWSEGGTSANRHVGDIHFDGSIGAMTIQSDNKVLSLSYECD